MACFNNPSSTFMDLLPSPDWEAHSLRLRPKRTRSATTPTTIAKRRRRGKRTSRCQDSLQVCCAAARPLPGKEEDSLCRVVLCFVETEGASSVDGVGGQCRFSPVLGIVQDIDSSPAQAAWRTIQDQTTLPTTSLSVFRHGKPFPSEDPLPMGRKCIFYPFAFRKHDGRGSGNDMDPSLKNDLGHICYVREGLQNIWFEVELGPIPGRILANGLRQLQQDHESGARKLAAVCLGVLQDVLEHLDDTVSLDGPWWQKTCLAAWHLWKNGRPSMDAAIVSFLLLTLGEITSSLSSAGTGPLCKRMHIRGAFDNIQKTMRSYTSHISTNLASYMKSKNNSKPARRRNTFTILTLSASSTIRECIVQAALASGAPFINVRVLESRPLFEGVSMAASILSSFEALPHPHHHSHHHHTTGTATTPQVCVTIYTDASVSQAATDVDLLLLGADRISSSGSVSNKTGSVPAALSVRHMAPPDAETIVVSEIYKVAMSGSNGNSDAEEHAIMENNEASEVMQAWEQSEKLKGLDVVQSCLESPSPGQCSDQCSAQGQGQSQHVNCEIAHGQLLQQNQPTVNVQNVYFEWVPPSLIDTYICEDGVKTTVDFQRQSRWVSEQCGLIFGRY